MSANVETMFYVREKPWHGLGTLVMEAPASADALVWAGLNWKVIQKEVRTEDGDWIAGYKANVRSTDGSVLGIVSDRYKGCRMRMLSASPTSCWERASPTKPPVPCSMAARFGCWPGCPSGISSPETRSNPTW